MANTLDKLYDLNSFDIAKNYFATQDSAGGTILARNLEHISSEIFKQRIAGLTFLTGAGITINNEGGYADAIKKLKESIQGDFADAGQMTDSQGKISLGVEDDTIPVYYKEAMSSWSDLELQKASLQNRNLPAAMIAAHDEKYKQTIDKLGYLGNGTKTEGLLNFSGFAIGSASGAFSTLTGQQMFDEVAELITDQRSAVFNDEVFSCDRAVVHQDTYNLMSKTYLNTAGGLTTVREALERTMNISFVITNKAEISSVKRIVVYSSQRQAMQMRIPVPLKLYNQFTQGSRHSIESMFGVAGLDIIENASGRILTGV
jgi:hypothetical protein